MGKGKGTFEFWATRFVQIYIRIVLFTNVCPKVFLPDVSFSKLEVLP